MMPLAFRRVALALCAAPLALGLVACKKSENGSASVATGPIAATPPPAGKQWSEVVRETPEGGMAMGNPNAPIKLLEYGSLSCPHCAKLANEGMQQLIDKYVNSGRVQYEFRSFAIHGIDVPLTVLARCGSPEAFFGLVEQLYSNQDAVITRAQQGDAKAQAAATLPPNQRMVAMADAYGLPDFFAQRGVSVDQAHACLANPAAAESVAKNAQTWGDAGIDSTPTLLINGRKVDAHTWAELEPALQSAGAR
ncbi:MAG: thioredoxin domain-containing protein [Novosphingobium sp.]|nr:thioredoxin domain-containing protein [Novosphingobium sp.]